MRQSKDGRQPLDHLAQEPAELVVSDLRWTAWTATRCSRPYARTTPRHRAVILSPGNHRGLVPWPP